MRTTRKPAHRWIVSILSIVFLFGFVAASHADTPPPVPIVPVAASPATPAPAPALPVQQTPPPVIPPKREDEPIVVPPKADPANGPTPPARPNVFQRAMAHLQTREGVASELAQRDQQIATLQQQLGQRDQTITQLTNELTGLRTGYSQLEQAVNRLETDQKTVVDTVAGLGFDPNKLPKAGSLEQVAENTVEGIQALLKDEKDDAKRGELIQRMITLRDAKK